MCNVCSWDSSVEAHRYCFGSAEWFMGTLKLSFLDADRYLTSEAIVFEGCCKPIQYHLGRSYVQFEVVFHALQIVSVFCAVHHVKAVLVAPIRGNEGFPRDRVERLSARYPMQWSASGSSELIVPTVESHF